MAKKVIPTRLELTKLKKRLKIAIRGHKLLRDKQDEMARQFMKYIKQNKELRKNVELEISNCMGEVAMACAIMGKDYLNEALLAPANVAKLKTSFKNIMSVETPVVKATLKEKINLPYSFLSTCEKLDLAVLKFAKLLPSLIKLAQVEKTCNMLADEMEKTRRRVNALERVMIPQMQRSIKYITMKLEDSERENITRLMKVKEMVIN